MPARTSNNHHSRTRRTGQRCKKARGRGLSVPLKYARKINPDQSRFRTDKFLGLGHDIKTAFQTLHQAVMHMSTMQAWEVASMKSALGNHDHMAHGPCS
eukprot:346254-Pelagomonas_calceolata.AAC.8